MDYKWKSRYSPGKNVSTHQYIIEIVCENLAKKDGKELPFQFWKLKDWKWNYIKQSSECKKLRERHGELKVLDFVIKNRIWSLKAKWISEAIEKWSFSEDPKSIQKLQIVIEPTLGKKKASKTNLFEGL